ncbi:hypothetical protein CJ030_MR1G004849 [Morella rubra]|uniref:Reverse transcriptase zinc-binding domain-containing protein n=1 Tax=Morella rubra TaxID=262757 RepID=A0A6A1WP98_9ROSI|nr:hypothetical protein CJ030_MR1G004849 [Morella rubra]
MLASQEAQLQVELHASLKNEELLWRSKSRNQWLATPELNTRFFHVTTFIRRRRNFIEGLKSETGCWLNSHMAIGDYLCSNFQNLFATSSPTLPGDISDLFSPIITDADNDFLCRVPDEAEIFTVVHSVEAPGPDGITALF